MKIRLRLIRARPIFYMNSDNPSVSLGIVAFSLYTRRIALKDVHQKKLMDMLAYTPVEFNYLETLAKTFIFPARQSSSFRKTFLTKLQFVRLLLQWIKTLHSLDHTLKIHSGVNNLVSDNLENSQRFSQSYTLMLLVFVAFMLRKWKQWALKMISPQFQWIIPKTTLD